VKKRPRRKSSSINSSSQEEDIPVEDNESEGSEDGGFTASSGVYKKESSILKGTSSRDNLVSFVPNGGAALSSSRGRSQNNLLGGKSSIVTVFNLSNLFGVSLDIAKDQEVFSCNINELCQKNQDTYS